MLLRLVALVFFGVLSACEAWLTYEFLLGDRGKLDAIVVVGVVFALASCMLPMFSSVLRQKGQWTLAIFGWVCMPIVLGVVYFAAIERTGGAADKKRLENLRITRAGTLAAKTEEAADKTWQNARDAADRECNSGPVKQQRGPKCIEAEGKQKTAWEALLAARKELAAAPATGESPGSRRAVAVIPWVTIDQVELYQPLLIPLGMSILGAFFCNVAFTMRTPRMPRPWENWRRRRSYPDNRLPTLPAKPMLSQAKDVSYPVSRKTSPAAQSAGPIIELRPDGSRRFVLDDTAIEWAQGRR